MFFNIANLGDIGESTLVIPSATATGTASISAGGYLFVNNTSGGPITLTVAPALLPFLFVKDTAGNAQTNNITVTSSAGIDAGNSLVLTENYQSVELAWNGTSYSSLKAPETQYEINSTAAHTASGSGFLIDTAYGNFTGATPPNETIFAKSIGTGTSAPIFDALTLVFNNASGQTVDLANGLGIYLVNDGGSTSTFPVACAQNIIGINRKDNSSMWGLNCLLTDGYGQVLGSAAGRHLFNELDFNICSPGTEGTLLQLGINGPAQSTTGVNGIGFISGDPTQFSFSGPLIISGHGVGAVFAYIGAISPSGNSISSQVIDWHCFGTGGVLNTMSMGMLPSGTINGTLALAMSPGVASLNVQGTIISGSTLISGGDINMPDTFTLHSGGHALAAGLGGAAFLATDASWGNITLGNTTANLHFAGPLSFENQTTVTGGNTATLTNSPTSGNPTEWLTVKVNGNTRHLPAWA